MVFIKPFIVLLGVAFCTISSAQNYTDIPTGSTEMNSTKTPICNSEMNSTDIPIYYAEMVIDNAAAQGMLLFNTTREGLNFEVDMNVYDVDSGKYNDCISSDNTTINLKWHIHVGRPIGGQGIGSECGGTVGNPAVGGHYDPTFACGSATDNVEECAVLKRNTENNFNYTCNPEIYKINPYACEVGDYSGKFGKLSFMIHIDGKTATAKHTSIDKYGPPLGLVLNRAITFHCDSPRMFCASIQESGSNATALINS
eukprot:CFRG4512T1